MSDTQRNASVLAIILLLSSVFAGAALAHGGDAQPSLQAGSLIFLGFAPPSDLPVDPPSRGELGGEARVWAWQQDGLLRLRVATPTAGWAFVGIEEKVTRELTMQSMKMGVEQYAGTIVGATEGDVALPLSFSRLTSSGDHQHGPDEFNGLLNPGGNPYVETFALRSDGVTLTDVTIPLEALGGGVRVRDVYQVAVAWSPYTKAPDFFLNERPHEFATFGLYIAAPGEGAQTFEAVIAALDSDGTSPAGVVGAVALGLASLSIVAFLASRGQLAGPGTGRGALSDAFFPFFVTLRRAGPRATPALALALIMVLPTLLPTANATTEYVAGPLPPPSAGGGNACTPDMPVKRYNVSAIDMDIVFNHFGDHDPEGNMYVLDEKRSAAQAERAQIQTFLNGGGGSFPTGANDSLIVPLTLRVHQGDCLEIKFTNALLPDPPVLAHPPHAAAVHPIPGGLSDIDAPPSAFIPEVNRRASLHVHGLPIDPRASGSAVGNNPDGTVPINGTIIYRIPAVVLGTFFFHDHGDTSAVGAATFRTLSGDDFRGSNTHGLFGAIHVEPRGSQWLHPQTGAPVNDGLYANIVMPDGSSYREFTVFYHDPQVIGPDNQEVPEPMEDHGLNYRVETMSRRIFFNDDRCPAGASTRNHGINPCQDPALVYSSFVHGDPATPILRGYMGDKAKVKLIHAGMEETHAHHLHNHRWQAVDGNPRATVIDSQSLSPSETWTESLDMGLGGESGGKTPGDSIFHCHLFPHLYGGMWGILRTHDKLENDLLPLPDNTVANKTEAAPGFPSFMINAQRRELGLAGNVTDGHALGNVISDFTGHRPPLPPQTVGPDPRTGLVTTAAGAPYNDPCPPTAPVRKYHLVGISTTVRFNNEGDYGDVSFYSLAEDVPDFLAGKRNPEPIVLRIAKGECMEIFLENHLPEPVGDIRIGLTGTKLSIHPHLYSFDVLGSDGLSTGWNFDTGIWQNESITYRYYADEELQTSVWHDHTAGLQGVLGGMMGATLMEPEGASWRDPRTGGPIYSMGADNSSGYLDSSFDSNAGVYSHLWEADIIGPGFKDFREFFLSVQDFVSIRDGRGRDYRPNVEFPGFADFGLFGFNYRTEPLAHRVREGPEKYFDSHTHGDPATPLFEAYAGDRTVFRIHQVPFEEAHSFTLQGHRWNWGYRDPLSPIVDTFTLGVSEAFNAYLDGGAGGPLGVPGDYLYRDASVDDMFGGAWGIFRVHGKAESHLLPLPDHASPPLTDPKPANVNPCPPTAPVRTYDVHAMQKDLVYNAHGDHDPLGMMYVLKHHVKDVWQGLPGDITKPEATINPEPMTLRVNEGDCVKIRLQNDLPDWMLNNIHARPQITGGSFIFNLNANDTRDLLNVSFGNLTQIGNHTGMSARLLLHDVRDSGGVKVGRNPDSTVAPGQTKTYTYYADTANINLAFVEDLADPLTHKAHGLFGGIIVMPKGAVAVNPTDGHRESHDPIVDVKMPDGSGWRDVALYMQDGITLTSPDGRPVPQRDAERPEFVTAADAAKRALFVLVRTFGDNADHRAHVQSVRAVEDGWSVRIKLDSWHVRIIIDGENGDTRLMESARDERWLASGGLVQLSDSKGAPLQGWVTRLEHGGKPLSANGSGPDGVAWFPGILPRGNLLKVRVGAEPGFDTWVRTDSEGRFQLMLRGDTPHFGQAGALEQAGDRALASVAETGLVAGGIGVRAIDVTGAIWRVDIEDAVRKYTVEIDPAKPGYIAMVVDSKAQTLATPSFIPFGEMDKNARNFLKHHFGSKDLEMVESTRDRFGVWRGEFDGNDWSHSIQIDGATGRVLRLVRTLVEDSPLAGLAGASDTTLRLRREDAGPLAGTMVSLHSNGSHVPGVPTIRNGRVMVDPVTLMGPVRPGEVVVHVPTLDLEFPWNVQPNVTVFSELDGLASSARVKPSMAIEIARRWIVSHQPSTGENGTGSPFAPGLVSLSHKADGWHVVFGDHVRVTTIIVDDANGKVSRMKATTWRSPNDDCSGQPIEHFGPHSPPACPWSFASLDEEDQGLKGYNYRSEPYEWRLFRHPDPAYVHSSSVHGDPWTPMPEAYVGDPVRIHLASAMAKPRAGAFSLDGHVWPHQPNDPNVDLRQGQGGLVPGRVMRLDLKGGAGGIMGLAGDYLYQGAVQRHQAETGQWGILRVYDHAVNGLRQLAAALPTDPGWDGGSPPTTPPAATCAKPWIGHIKRTLSFSGGKWTLTGGPDGSLVTPTGDARLLVNVTGVVDPSRFAFSASAGKGWSENVVPLGRQTDGTMAYCVHVSPKNGPAQTLSLELTFDVLRPDGSREARLKAVLAFAPPTTTSSTSSLETETSNEVPSPGLLAMLAASLVGAALFARRRRPRRPTMLGMMPLAGLLVLAGVTVIADDARAATHDVSMVNRRFTPSSLEVSIGDTVRFVNDDSRPHTVTSMSGGALSSGNMDPGAVYTKTFETEGSYTYRCLYHDQMIGTVKVVAQAATPPPQQPTPPPEETPPPEQTPPPTSPTPASPTPASPTAPTPTSPSPTTENAGEGDTEDRLRVTVDTRPAGGSLRGPVSLLGETEARGADNARTQLKVDDGEWRDIGGTGAWMYVWDTTKVSDGAHLLSFRAVDGDDESAVVWLNVQVANGGGTSTSPPPGEEAPASPPGTTPTEQKQTPSPALALQALALGVMALLRNPRRPRETSASIPNVHNTDQVTA